MVPSLSEPPALKYLRERDQYFFKIRYSNTFEWEQSETNGIRIAIIGDSFTHGGGVQLGDRFADKLDFWLNLKPENKPVNVKVFAKSGSSTPEQIPLLDEALQEKADLILLVMCLNDMEDRSQGEQLKKWREAKSPSPPAGPWKAVTDRSRFLLWSHYRLQGFRCRKEFLAYYEHIYDDQYSGWQSFKHAASEFTERCDKAGVSLIVVIFPLLSHNMDSQRYPFIKFHKAIKRVWNERGVDVLDLFDSMKNLDPLRLQVIPGGDPHPSEIAHRIAAEAILDYLVKNRYLPSDYFNREMTRRDSQFFWSRKEYYW